MSHGAPWNRSRHVRERGPAELAPTRPPGWTRSAKLRARRRRRRTPGHPPARARIRARVRNRLGPARRHGSGRGSRGRCRGQWRAAYVIKEGSEGSASQSKEGSVSYTYIHTYINIENTYIHTYRLQYVCMCVRTYVRTHDAMGAGGAWAGRDCRRKKGRRVLPTRMGRSDSLPDSSLYKYIYILYKYITYI